MLEEIEKPRLRPVEAVPVQADGKSVIALRDPQGLAQQMILLPREALAVIALFDGQHTVPDVQEAFKRQYQQLLPSDVVKGLIGRLDEYHFLDSPSFQTYKTEVERTFRESRFRPAAHAGQAYAAEPEELTQQLDNLFIAPGAPGQPDETLCAAPIDGLVAPHIDFTRGGNGYAHAYKTLAETEPAELYVILGVAHSACNNPFVLTEKNFETPLGVAQTDREFCRRLVHLGPNGLLDDELTHKNEHSIEFQVLLLQHLHRTIGAPLIVPILVGSFQEMILAGTAPEDNPRVRQFIDALRETLEEERRRKRVCVIAGVDLSHVGRQFGDPEELTPAFLEQVQQSDRRFLQYLVQSEAYSLFEMIAAEKDRRKVCGFPALYTFLRVLPQRRGQLLHYQQWADPPSGCSVSFASLAFRSPGDS